MHGSRLRIALTGRKRVWDSLDNNMVFDGAMENSTPELEIDISELSKYMEDGYELIDVRDELSFAYGNIKGSVNIPGEKLLENAAEYTGRKLLLYCREGDKLRAC